MKIIALFLSVASILFSTQAWAQVHWTRFGNNPVLCMDTTVMWEAMGQPTVMFENDTFKMWYAVAGPAAPGDTVVRGRIHYATSSDGYVWTKSTVNPVLEPGQSGEWDGQNMDTPEILKDATGYKLFYFGDSTYYQSVLHTAIGLATSPDGIHWTRQGKIIQRGAPGDWDGVFVESPAAYWDSSSGLYALWYTGMDTTGFVRVGLALSGDLQNWVKYPGQVLDVGPSNTWEDKIAGVPAIIRTRGILEMWYSGCQDIYHTDTVKTGYAVSMDGAHWIKYPGNPVLAPSFPGDTTKFWAVDAVYDSLDNTYKLYFESKWKSDAEAIYLATAPRDVLFSSSCNVSAGNDITITQGNSTVLHATGASLYRWLPETGLDHADIPEPAATPDSTTTYTVLAVSQTCIDTAFVTVNVLPSGNDFTAGIRNTFDIYPNPAKDYIIIDPLKKTESYQVELSDITGRIVLKSLVNGKTRTDISSLNQGLYILKLGSGESANSQLIVIQW
jgi:predicted GH43/DUF377 family glycosyl hydrolase